MTLKAVLENLDGVPESLRTEYKQFEGKFYLDIEQLDDHHGVGALKRAKDYEKENARKAREDAAKIQSDLDAANLAMEELKKNGIPKGDVERLEQSYKDKYAKEEQKLKDRIALLNTSLEAHMLDGQARKIAADMALKPEYIDALLPHIRNRLKLEESESGAHSVRVLDKEGAISASSLSDLDKEVRANPALGPLIAGSKSTGGGAKGGDGGNGGGASKKLSEMNQEERTKFAKEDPAGFQKAVDDAKAASRAASA